MPKQNPDFIQLRSTLLKFCQATNETEDYLQLSLSKDPLRQSIYDQNEIDISLLEKHCPLPLDSAKQWLIENSQKAKKIIHTYTTSQVDLQLTEPEWTFPVRQGQREATQQAIDKKGHSGLFVFPGGYGKTRLGLMLFLLVKKNTLIVAPNAVILKQWLSEWKTLLGQNATFTKEAFPFKVKAQKDEEVIVDACTYNDLKKKRIDDHALLLLDEVHHVDTNHLSLFKNSKTTIWGLTATPHFKFPEMTFTAIGPTLFQLQSDTKTNLNVSAVEIFIPMDKETKLVYFSAKNAEQRHRLSSVCQNKISIVSSLLKKHCDDKIIIIGEYLEGLKEIGKKLKIELLDGASSSNKRFKFYKAFNQNKSHVLLTSQISEEGVDLPQANCVIEVSTNFYRKSSAKQRLGRITRFSENEVKQAHYYRLITEGSEEESRHFEIRTQFSSAGVEFKRIDISDI